MLTRYDPRFAHDIFGICSFAPPGDDDDDDDDDDKSKKGGGGKDGGDDDKTDWKAEADKWKRLSRRHESDARSNKAAADKLAELEGANKSDVEKLTQRAEAAEGKLATAERDLLRVRVALRKGLNEIQARRLVGDTEDEMEADADDLLETFGGGKKADDADQEGRNRNDRNGNGGGDGNGRRPRENLRPGAKPDAKPEELDPIKLAEAVPRGGI
jgi:hypothetical protein